MSDPNATVKELLVRLEGKFETLETKIDGWLQAQDQAARDMRDDLKDHELRLRDLESRKTISPLQLWTVVSGGLLVAVAIVTLVLNVVKP